MKVTVRDHDDKHHEILIPDGWHPVNVQTRGLCGRPQIGDRFLDVNYLTVNGGQSWRTLESLADLDLVWPKIYGCLIRKNAGAEVYQGAGI